MASDGGGFGRIQQKIRIEAKELRRGSRQMRPGAAVGEQHAGSIEGASPAQIAMGSQTLRSFIDPPQNAEQGFWPGVGDKKPRNARWKELTKPAGGDHKGRLELVSWRPQAAGLDNAGDLHAPSAFAQAGGGAASFRDQQASLKAHLPLALLLVALTTLALLFALTRSVLLPLKALLLNLLTLSAAFGVLVLIFQDGHLEGLLGFESQGALESTQPILLFALAFGLATDYGVFLLSRIKEARDAGETNREAIALGVARTGRIVTAAMLLFCVAIGAFATSRIVFIKELAVGTGIAVFLDATLVRALLVPSLMALLGEWNWWAPSLRRKP